IGMVKTAQHIEERRLAGAVGTDKAADLPAIDAKGDPVQRDDAAEPDRKPVDTEERPPTAIGGDPTHSRLMRVALFDALAGRHATPKTDLPAGPSFNGSRLGSLPRCPVKSIRPPN